MKKKKMMLKMQKINKAGKVVVNYLSTLHLSPKQFVLEVLLKIPNFWKTSKKKHVGRRESPHQAPRWFRSKLAQNASRYFTASSTIMWTFEAIRNPTPTPEKPFRASFPQKTADCAKETVDVLILSKLVKRLPQEPRFFSWFPRFNTTTANASR